MRMTMPPGEKRNILFEKVAFGVRGDIGVVAIHLADNSIETLGISSFRHELLTLVSTL